MFVIVGLFLFLGIRILAHPSANNPAWLGWLLLGVAVFKASLWSFVTVGFIRNPQAVGAARHWE
jgi:hypothetical protein